MLHSYPLELRKPAAVHLVNAELSNADLETNTMNLNCSAIPEKIQRTLSDMSGESSTCRSLALMKPMMKWARIASCSTGFRPGTFKHSKPVALKP